jgi:hypothetical protein
MADFRAIMSLVFKGRSYRQIVEAVGCSHRDVSTVRKVVTDRGITAARLAGMSDAELAGLFPDGRSGVSTGYDGPDFARVAASMRSNPHFTLLQAWRGYVGSVSDLRKYAYSQYCHLFGQYAVRNDLVATLHHEPGRAMFVDWAGDTIGLVDAAVGKPAVAYLGIVKLFGNVCGAVGFGWVCAELCGLQSFSRCRGGDDFVPDREAFGHLMAPLGCAHQVTAGPKVSPDVTHREQEPLRLPR